MYKIIKTSFIFLTLIIISTASLHAQCWILFLITDSSYWEGSSFVVEHSEKVIASWCTGSGGGSGGGDSTMSGSAATTAAGLMLQNSKDCVKSFLSQSGFGTNPGSSKLALQSSSIDSPDPMGPSRRDHDRWLSMGSPFTYQRTDGTIGMYWDQVKIEAFKMSSTDTGTILGYRSVLDSNPDLSAEKITAAKQKIQAWVTTAANSTGATALTYLALGRSLGSTQLDLQFLMGHEMGHIMASNTDTTRTHADYWINDSGELRLDLAQTNTNGNMDTFGILMAADAKAKTDGTTVEAALRTMGLIGLAESFSAKFGSGGC